MFENYLLISKITPQTSDQYWSTFVYTQPIFNHIRNLPEAALIRLAAVVHLEPKEGHMRGRLSHSGNALFE